MKVTQSQLEHLLHKQHLLNELKVELDNDLTDYIDFGVKTLKDWLNQEYWDSKNARLDKIRYQDLRSIVLKVIANIVLSCQQAMPMVSLASMTNLSDEFTKPESIQTAGEIITILAKTELYSVSKGASGTYVVQALTLPSEELERKIQIGCYLPPLVEKPKLLEKNTDCALHTIKKDRLILGGALNDHSGNISLDVLNRLNQIEYELDPHSIEVEKDFTREELTPQQVAELNYEDREQYEMQLNNYEMQKEQFNYLKTLLKGRTIHFAHKVDKRGRIYSQGYHFNPMGSSYEKSCLNLAKKELVTGEL